MNREEIIKWLRDFRVDNYANDIKINDILLQIQEWLIVGDCSVCAEYENGVSEGKDFIIDKLDEFIDGI